MALTATIALVVTPALIAAVILAAAMALVAPIATATSVTAALVLIAAALATAIVLIDATTLVAVVPASMASRLLVAVMAFRLALLAAAAGEDILCIPGPFSADAFARHGLQQLFVRLFPFGRATARGVVAPAAGERIVSLPLGLALTAIALLLTISLLLPVALLAVAPSATLVAAVAAIVPGGMRRGRSHAGYCIDGQAAIQHIRMIFYDGDLPRDELLNIAQEFFFFSITKRKRNAAGACPAGPADPMDVSLRDIRQLEIDHMGQVVDIDTPCGDIGRHEDAGMAALEVYECALPGVLRFVAMNGFRTYTRPR